MTGIKFSVGGSGGLGWDGHLEVARACEDLGFYGFYPSDHLMPIVDRGGGSSERLDAPTAIAALAGQTTRLRLGCLVQANLFRHPVLTAMMCNTLDHATGGRAELGLGAGANRHEYDVHGFPYPDSFHERVDRLDEALALIKLLFTQERTTFEGRFYRVHDAPFAPRPVQQPHPPITVGGMYERTMRVAARHANEWNALGPLRVVESLVVKMRDICAEEGRDFSTLRISRQGPVLLSDDRSEVERFLERQAAMMRSHRGFKPSPLYSSVEEQAADTVWVGDAPEMIDSIGRWREIGVTHFNFTTPRPFHRPMLERFAADVMPAFA